MWSLRQIITDPCVEGTDPGKLGGTDRQTFAKSQHDIGSTVLAIRGPAQSESPSLPCVASPHDAVTIEEAAPTPSERAQARQIVGRKPEPNRDCFPFVGGIAQSPKHPEIGVSPAGRQHHLVQQHTQEAIQLSQAIADHLRTIAPRDGNQARTGQAGTEKSGSAQKREMGLLNANGRSSINVGILTLSKPAYHVPRPTGRRFLRDEWSDRTWPCRMVASPVDLPCRHPTTERPVRAPACLWDSAMHPLLESFYYAYRQQESLASALTASEGCAKITHLKPAHADSIRRTEMLAMVSAEHG